MMYGFIDTNEQPGALPLPAEAMSYNGVYIEHEINGYRTLYVEGRETISAVIDYAENKIRDGARYRKRHYEPRTLTIGYQLVSDTAEHFMAAYNSILSILSEEQAQIIFADEPDKFYVGTKAVLGSVPPGRLSVTGEITILCADPFKYSVREYTATAEEVDGQQIITANYGGTYPARPVLSAISEEHDNGFYAFVNDSSAVIQVGDPDEIDKLEVTDQNNAETVFSYRFNNADDPEDYWEVNQNAILKTWSHAYYIDGGWLFGNYWAHPNYGYWGGTSPSYDYYYGPTLSHTFTEAEGTDIQSFDCTFAHWFEPIDQNRAGGFELYVSDTDGAIICGVAIWHTKNDSVRWAMLVGERTVKTGAYTLAKNPFKGVWSTCRLRKLMDHFSITLGGVTFTTEASDMLEKRAANISMIAYYMPSSLPMEEYCSVQRVNFRKVPHDWAEVYNKIPLGSEVVIDTGSGEITLGGAPAYDLGAIGNQFEGFELHAGQNQIMCEASSWATDAVYTMTYREVFL